MGYWRLVEPIWHRVSIYDGPDTFLGQYQAAPHASRALFAAHWCQSEVRNGGFEQFFSNATGVLAPEAVVAFQALGLPRTADVLRRAMALFGPTYLRDQDDRGRILDDMSPERGAEGAPFGDLDDEFDDLLQREGGGFEAAADRYAIGNY